MLVKRTIVVLIFAPLALLAIYLGGWVYTLAILTLLSIATWEFWRMVTQAQIPVSLYLLLGGVALMVLARAIFGSIAGEICASLLILIAMSMAVIAYERGQELPINTFAYTLTGLFYIGWLGSFLISLRNLPSGQWWMLVAVPTAWAGDVGAYLIGSAFGRHRMAPRVSPKKSWEGYVGGVAGSMIWCIATAFAVQSQTSDITILRCIFLGTVVGLTAPMGDLFESLLKRQFGVKDSSNLLPGHGGFLDRIDSTLWTGVVSYFLIVLLMMH